MNLAGDLLYFFVGFVVGVVVAIVLMKKFKGMLSAAPAPPAQQPQAPVVDDTALKPPPQPIKKYEPIDITKTI